MNIDKTKNIEKLDEQQELESKQEETDIDDIILRSEISKESEILGNNKFLSRGFLDNPNKTENLNKLHKHGCCKLDSKNWLKDVSCCNKNSSFKIVEVRFKNNRKDFYKLPEEGIFAESDLVVVEASPGHDIGIISLMGDVVKLQMKNKRIDPDSEDVKRLFRRARFSDIEKWVTSIENEKEAIIKTRQFSADLRLNMKINDVEYQADGTKAIFYYSSDDRVDFREMIKMLAERFRVRIEMRQIGVRQEASRLGGIGSCGRELCCSSWLTTFNSVTTNAARVQQLSLNPQKLAGQCSKLKCCLNYEYDTYIQEYKTFPDTSKILRTRRGDAIYNKTDIFKKMMWYSYSSDTSRLFAIPADKVEFIISENKKGKMPECLEDFSDINHKKTEYDLNTDAESLGRFDKNLED